MSEEKYFTGPIDCHHCRNKAPMEVVASYEARIGDSSFSDPTGFASYDASDIYQLCKCPACSELTLRSYFWADYMDPEDVSMKYLYPTPQKFPEGLPPKISKEYRAALGVRHLSANAYGVLIGRVLELICEDRGATGRNLYQKLQDLASKNEIPTNLVDVAQRLRDMRNLGAHAVLGELSESEIPIVDNLIEALLDYVYTAPQLVGIAEKRLDELKTHIKKVS